MAEAVWANVAIRVFSGFLLFFLLFLVQDQAVPWLAAAEPWARDPFFDIPKTIALLAGAAGLGAWRAPRWRTGRATTPRSSSCWPRWLSPW
ncbi:hypothetical protein [Nonomuraea rubra]|uniref:hypothetical protein n=1 Tax=Nonomuraea rubra TaxID=46180 RepID=UPI0031ED1670